MELTLVTEGGATFVEGRAGEAFLATAADASRLLEACLSGRTRAALLYRDNVTPAFFDLSSGDAGAVLQKLRNYRVRLAVVCPPGSVAFSSRFPEVLAAEQRAGHLGVFERRDEAIAWLGPA